MRSEVKQEESATFGCVDFEQLHTHASHDFRRCYFVHVGARRLPQVAVVEKVLEVRLVHDASGNVGIDHLAILFFGNLFQRTIVLKPFEADGGRILEVVRERPTIPVFKIFDAVSRKA